MCFGFRKKRKRCQSEGCRSGTTARRRLRLHVESDRKINPPARRRPTTSHLHALPQFLIDAACCCHGRRRWSRRPAPAHRRWRASKHATASPPVTAARIGRHALVMVRTGKKRGAPHASCDRARRPGPGPVPPGWFVS